MSLETSLEIAGVAIASADGYELTVSEEEDEKFNDVYRFLIIRSSNVALDVTYSSLEELIKNEDVETYHGVTLDWQPDGNGIIDFSFS